MSIHEEYEKHKKLGVQGIKVDLSHGTCIYFEEPWCWNEEDIQDIIQSFKESRTSEKSLGGGGGRYYWTFRIIDGLGFIDIRILKSAKGNIMFSTLLDSNQTHELMDQIIQWIEDSSRLAAKNFQF